MGLSLSLDPAAGAGHALAILRTNGVTILINNTLVVVGCFIPIAIVAFVLGGLLFLFSYSSTWPNLLVTVFLRVLVAAVVVTFEVAMNAFMAVFVYFMQVSHCWCLSIVLETAVSVSGPQFVHLRHYERRCLVQLKPYSTGVWSADC